MVQGPADTEERQAAELFRRVAERDPLFAPHCELFFEQIGELGSGGMGRVLRVRDRRLGREAALKLLAEPENLALRERFLREARLLARLDHPNIPPLYELGRGPGTAPYILMRAVEGRTLRALLLERDFENDEPRALLRVLARVADALAYAHDAGVVHRDLKPENIMVGEYGAVFVIDWGLARELGGSDDEIAPGWAAGSEETASGLTEEGASLGTPGYMAPEQASGRPADARADVFALGCILTEILTGQRAVEGSDVLARIANTIKGRARSPRQILAAASAPLDDLARRCLSHDPAARPRHAGAFGRELGRIIAASPPSRPWWLILVWLSGAALTAAALAGFGVFAYERGERAAAEREWARREQLRRGQDIKSAARLYEHAVSEYKRGEFEEARELLSMVLEFDRGNVGALCLRGAAAQRSGKLIAARSDFNEAILLDPDAPLPILNRGFLNLEEGVLANARQDFERALSLDPKSALAMKGLGDLETSVGRWTAAVERYTEAIALSPSLDQAYVERARAQSELGDIEEALDDLSFALELSPKNVTALKRRGLLYNIQGEPIAAFADLDKAAALAPRDPSVYASRAIVHLDRQDHQRAIADLDRALTLDPKYPGAHQNRGVALTRLRRFAAAISDLDRSIELEPENPQGHLQRAITLHAVGRLEEALRDYLRAEELEPRLASIVKPPIDRIRAQLDARPR